MASEWLTRNTVAAQQWVGFEKYCGRGPAALRPLAVDKRTHRNFCFGDMTDESQDKMKDGKPSRRNNTDSDSSSTGPTGITLHCTVGIHQ